MVVNSELAVPARGLQLRVWYEPLVVGLAGHSMSSCGCTRVEGAIHQAVVHVRNHIWWL